MGKRDFDAVLRSAARLQELVPDAVLVGGSAAVLYDHDHVQVDLEERFDAVLEALESDPEWVLNRAVPGKILLGNLGDIEAGVRQLIRNRPLETRREELPGGAEVTVPTAEETLRIKAYLLVKRNQTRDYIDVAALSDRFGVEWAAGVLGSIDDYYSASRMAGDDVATQVVRQLAEPRPKDSRTTASLGTYKGLAKQWTDWTSVVQQCQRIADAMLD
ncbi:MAG: hypothetical protein GX610_01895 [Rhodococcus sp.]|nr:hypothetical protein [Rhodococcus sp. (in: high G+C Gram-positive bacteria)]